MRFRLYYWFDGAPADRPGGPWWYRDFYKEDNPNAFLVDCKSFLYKWAEMHGDDLPRHDPMRIYPPKSLQIRQHSVGKDKKEKP